MSSGIVIGNAVVNGFGTPIVYTGLLAQRPAVVTAGAFYLSLDNSTMYYYNGAAWVVFIAGVSPITIPLPVNQGGTGTITAFTPGSVVFAGASGVYSQDNAGFFYDNTNKILRITGPNNNVGGAASGQLQLNSSSAFGQDIGPDIAFYGFYAPALSTLFGQIAFRKELPTSGVQGAYFQIVVTGSEKLRISSIGAVTIGQNTALGKDPLGVFHVTGSMANSGTNLVRGMLLDTGMRNDNSNQLDIGLDVNPVFTQSNTIVTALNNATLTGGAGYTNGFYPNVVISNGGTGVNVAVVVAGGVIASVILLYSGSGFAPGNVLVFSGSPVGPGAGFSIQVLTVGSGNPSQLVARFSANAALSILPMDRTVVQIVNADGLNTRLLIEAYGSTNGLSPVGANYCSLLMRNARGTGAAPSALLLGDILGQFVVNGYGSSAFSALNIPIIRSDTTENWTDTARGNLTRFYNFFKGSQTYVETLRLEEGNVNAGCDGVATTSRFQVSQSTQGPGTVSTVAAALNVTGVNTQFFNTFRVGDTITVNGETKIIGSITSNTLMAVTVNWAGTNNNFVYSLVGGTRFQIFGNGNGFLGLNLGIGTQPINNIPLAISSANGANITQFRTADQVTDTEVGRLYWNGTVYTIEVIKTNAGIQRDLNLQSGGSAIRLSGLANTATSSGIEMRRDATGVTNLFVVASSSVQGTGFQSVWACLPTINQSAGGAGYRAAWISVFESGLGGGLKYLFDFGKNTAANGTGTHTSYFYGDNTGNFYCRGSVTTNYIDGNNANALPISGVAGAGVGAGGSIFVGGTNLRGSIQIFITSVGLANSTLLTIISNPTLTNAQYITLTANNDKAA
ncbi:MAG: hypothetical protein V4560_11615, partial [Bacteroidota bacterium]